MNDLLPIPDNLRTFAKLPPRFTSEEDSTREAKSEAIWATIPAERRVLNTHRVLRYLPEAHWADIAEDWGNPENTPARQRLVAAGIRDEWGQYAGEWNFGQPPHTASGHRIAMAGGSVDQENDHGRRNCPIVLDLATPTFEEGVQTWGKDYVMLSDGSHGPTKSSLGNRKSKLRYMRLTGHAENKSYTS